MSILEKIYSKADPEKWAHPELVDVYRTMNGMNTNQEAIFDSTIPYAERQADSKEREKKLVETMNMGVDSRAVTYEVNSKDGTKIDMFLIPPAKVKKKMPCLFVIPGGGLTKCMITGGSKMADQYNSYILSVKYRIIFDFKENEGGYPGTIDDLDAGYKWLIEHAGELGINPDKIIIYGGSSGGHLALALSHRLKKNGYYGHKPRGVITYSPIVDDRLNYATSTICGTTWDGKILGKSSSTWLGNDIHPALVPAEAFANRASAEECVGLPPTFIHVDELDPSAAPCLEYASKLMKAGVYNEIHTWGGSSHGVIESAPAFGVDSEYAKRCEEVIAGNINDCINYDLRRSWIDKLEEEN